MNKIFTLSLCLMALGLKATASTYSSDGLLYTLNDDATAAVASESETLAGEVVIPSAIEVDGITYTVNAISDHGFASCWDVTSVTLPTTIRTIGVRGFSHCGITEITLPEGLLSIGEEAFATKEGKGITSITIPASVSEIGVRAFYNDQLTTVDIKGDNNSPLLTIGDNAFGGTRSALGKIVIGRAEPPVLGENVFRKSDSSTPVELVGPATMHYQDYISAPGWNSLNILKPVITGIENVGINGISHTQSSGYYTLDGLRVNSPIPGGIYIVRDGNSVRKIRF